MTEKNESRELVRSDEQSILICEDPERFANQLVRINRAIMVVAIAVTRPRQWMDFNGVPYMRREACEALGSSVGISTYIVDKQKEIHSDEQGEYWVFKETVKASGIHPMTGQTVEAERTGVASTKDEFFSKRKGVRIPLSEIDVASVELKAETRAFNRAMRAVLGFNPTWDELKAAFGKRADTEVASVQYGGESAKKSTSTGKGVLNPTKRKIGELILEMAGGDQDLARRLHVGYSEIPAKDDRHGKPGVSSPKDLTDKHAEVVLHKVEREYEAYLQEQAGSSGEAE